MAPLFHKNPKFVISLNSMTTYGLHILIEVVYGTKLDDDKCTSEYIKKWKSFDFSKLLFQGPAWNWPLYSKTKPRNDQSGLENPNCTTKKCVKRPLCLFLYGYTAS